MADPVTMAVISIGMGVASGLAKQAATDTAIQEQLDTNADDIQEYQAETKDAWTATTASMANIAAENKYNVGVTAQKGTLETGATAAKLGYSGVKGASPLAALRQQERLASEGLAATTASANATLTQKGLDTSLLTQGYQRKIALIQKNSKYLEENRTKMNVMSFFGAVPDTVQTAGSWLQKAGS